MTVKSPPYQGSGPLRGRHHWPRSQGQLTPEPLMEEIGIHDRRQDGKGAVGGMAGTVEMTNVSNVRGNATIRSRFTPGNLWPRHPALEIYLLPVTHGHFSSCALPPRVLSATHPPTGHLEGLPVYFLQRFVNTPRPSTSAHKFPCCYGILRNRVVS